MIMDIKEIPIEVDKNHCIYDAKIKCFSKILCENCSRTHYPEIYKQQMLLIKEKKR
jgi:hypothetical protein